VSFLSFSGVVLLNRSVENRRRRPAVSKRKLMRLAACAVASIILLAGCEQIFTYSPIAFLQRPVSGMTTEQQIKFGQDALASGDDAKMAEAYAALAGNTASGDSQYTAAQLGIELSGIPDFLWDVVNGAIVDLPSSADSTDFAAFAAANNIQPAYLAQAAANLQNAAALGETLEPMDYIMGSFGLVIEAATQPDGSIDFTAMDAPTLAEAVAFIDNTTVDDLIASLPSTDPMGIILAGFQSYTAGL
jgi:hypothetical protein